MSSENRPRDASKPLTSLSALRDALAGEALPSQPERELVPARPATQKPITAQLVVRFERAGRGGKTVTIAEGPALAGRKLDELAREAAKALGVGARVEASTLVLQGDQCERLAAWFAKRGFASITLGTRS
ncbi:MAG: translation initiation factor [Planctomycetes bacterium]|nr:translation initiation factor [Planctomycetota bacterium]